MAVVAYEQRRIRSIRSTWVIFGVTLLLAAGIAAAVGALANIDPESGQRVGQGAMRDVLSAINNPIVLVPIAVLAAMAFGGEYRFGLIRQTLTLFPRRTGVFLAKLWVSVLWMFAFLVVAAVVVVGVAYLFRSNIVFDPLTSENLLYVIRALVFGVGFGLFAFALVVITRNQALSIVILVVWTVVVESLVAGLLANRAEWLVEAMPISAGASFVGGADMIRNAAIYFGVLAAFIIVGWALFTRRDA